MDEDKLATIHFYTTIIIALGLFIDNFSQIIAGYAAFPFQVGGFTGLIMNSLFFIATIILGGVVLLGISAIAAFILTLVIDVVYIFGNFIYELVKEPVSNLKEKINNYKNNKKLREEKRRSLTNKQRPGYTLNPTNKYVTPQDLEQQAEWLKEQQEMIKKQEEPVKRIEQKPIIEDPIKETIKTIRDLAFYLREERCREIQKEVETKVNNYYAHKPKTNDDGKIVLVLEPEKSPKQILMDELKTILENTKIEVEQHKREILDYRSYVNDVFSNEYDEPLSLRRVSQNKSAVQSK